MRYITLLLLITLLACAGKKPIKSKFVFITNWSGDTASSIVIKGDTLTIQGDSIIIMGGPYSDYDTVEPHYFAGTAPHHFMGTSSEFGTHGVTLTKLKLSRGLGHALGLQHAVSTSDTSKRLLWADALQASRGDGLKIDTTWPSITSQLKIDTWPLRIDTTWATRKYKFTEWCVVSYGDKACRDTTGKWTINGDTTALFEIIYREFCIVAAERDSLLKLK